MVLTDAADLLRSLGILLLVNYRPEYRHGWSSKSYYRQLQLDPLPPESAHEVLDALLGSDPGISALKRLFIERTEGNPFFLEESVRTLVESQALTGERGAHRLARPVDTIPPSRRLAGVYFSQGSVDVAHRLAAPTPRRGCRSAEPGPPPRSSAARSPVGPRDTSTVCCFTPAQRGTQFPASGVRAKPCYTVVFRLSRTRQPRWARARFSLTGAPYGG
jgi:hypothetical protein